MKIANFSKILLERKASKKNHAHIADIIVKQLLIYSQYFADTPRTKQNIFFHQYLILIFF